MLPISDKAWMKSLETNPPGEHLTAAIQAFQRGKDGSI